MEKELGGGGKRVVGGMVEKGEILEERGRERDPSNPRGSSIGGDQLPCRGFGCRATR